MPSSSLVEVEVEVGVEVGVEIGVEVGVEVGVGEVGVRFRLDQFIYSLEDCFWPNPLY